MNIVSVGLIVLDEYKKLAKNGDYVKAIALGNLYYAGNNFVGCVDYKKARKWYVLALKTMTEQNCNDKCLENDTLFYVALTMVENNENDGALKILEPLLQTVYIKLNTRDCVINILAAIYRSQGNIEKSFELYNGLYSRVEPVISNEVKICVCLGLGTNYLSCLNFKEAIKYFKEAIHLRSDSTSAHNNIGFCYESDGNLIKALKYYKLAVLRGSKFAPLNIWYLYTTKTDVFSVPEEEINKFYNLGKSKLEEWKKSRKLWEKTGAI